MYRGWISIIVNSFPIGLTRWYMFKFSYLTVQTLFTLLQPSPLNLSRSLTSFHPVPFPLSPSKTLNPRIICRVTHKGWDFRDDLKTFKQNPSATVLRMHSGSCLRRLKQVCNFREPWMLEKHWILSIKSSLKSHLFWVTLYVTT